MNFIKKLFLKWKEEEIQKRVHEEINELNKLTEVRVKNESIGFHNWVRMRYQNYRHEDHFNPNGTHVDCWDLWRIYVSQPEKRNSYILHASKEPKKIQNENNNS